MRKTCIIIFTILLLPLQNFAQEVALPHYLNFDGQLVDSSDNPITTATTVVFDIYDPSGNCLLYNETQTITPDANGEFSTKIGPSSGNTSSSNDGDLSWNVIFKNDGQLRGVVATYCPSGYTPAANHGRKLRVTVSGTPLTPDYTLAPVPMATVAETLQGKRASDFILANPTTSVSTHNGDFQLNNQSSLNLGNAVNPSTNFVSIQAPATFSAYTLTLPIDDGTAGQVLSTDGSGVLSWITPGGGGAITSVFGRTGVVTANANDYSASQITNTPAGNIAAVDIQAAINELDAEKLSSAAGTVTSALIADGTIATADLANGSVDSSKIADGTITDADMAGSGMSVAKIINAAGAYLAYRPNNVSCANNEVLKWNNGNSRWECGSDFSLLIGTSAGDAMGADAVPNCPSHQKLEMSPGPTYIWNCIDHQSSFGSAAAPGMTFYTDTDTGFFRPASDIIAVSTAGTERMRIDNTGNIAIGIASPTTLLDVNGAITSRPFGVSPGQTGQIIFRELAANGIESIKIRAPDSITANYALTLPPTPGTTGQVLQTDGSGVLSWVAGTSAIMPDTLDFTFFADAMNLDASTDISVSGSNILSVTNTGVGHSLMVNDQAGDTSPFVIDANGRVGVGVTSPIYPLDVVKTGTAGSIIDTVAKFSSDSANTITPGFGAGIQLAAKTSTVPAQTLASLDAFWSNPTDGTRTSTLQFSTVNNAAMLPKMVITGPGNVGIGALNPNAKLEIDGNTDPILDVKFGGATQLIAGSFGVGINTASPQATLHINGFMKLTPQASAPVACPGNAGAVAFNGTANLMCVCNGTNWRMMDGTSACGAW